MCRVSRHVGLRPAGILPLTPLGAQMQNRELSSGCCSHTAQVRARQTPFPGPGSVLGRCPENSVSRCISARQSLPAPELCPHMGRVPLHAAPAPSRRLFLKPRKPSRCTVWGGLSPRGRAPARDFTSLAPPEAMWTRAWASLPHHCPAWQTSSSWGSQLLPTLHCPREAQWCAEPAGPALRRQVRQDAGPWAPAGSLEP